MTGTTPMPADPTPDATERLRALAQQATPGPWSVDTIREPGQEPTHIIPDVVRWQGYTNSLNLGEDEATAAYIAAVSPDVVLDLLDRLAAAETDARNWKATSDTHMEARFAAEAALADARADADRLVPALQQALNALVDIGDVSDAVRLGSEALYRHDEAVRARGEHREANRA